MKYQLTFYNGKNLTYEQINESYVDAAGLDNIGKEKMDRILRELKGKKIDFKVLDEEEDEEEYFIDLQFEKYEVSVLDNSIGIIVPLSKKKQSYVVINEIQIISNVLLNNDMTGYDRQTNTVFGLGYNFANALNPDGVKKDTTFTNEAPILNRGPIIIEENPKGNPLKLIIILIVLFITIYCVVYLLQNK